MWGSTVGALGGKQNTKCSSKIDAEVGIEIVIPSGVPPTLLFKHLRFRIYAALLNSNCKHSVLSGLIMGIFV